MGCAAKSEPETVAPEPEPAAQVTAPAPVVEDEPAEPAPPCADDADCVAKGNALKEASDLAGARGMFEVGCEAGGAESCAAWASAVVREDEALAVTLWTKACEAGHSSSCFNAAEQKRESAPRQAVDLYLQACKPGLEDASLLGLACTRGAHTAYAERQFDHARTMASTICTETVTGGCGIYGVLLAKGQGGDTDIEGARAALDRACQAGNQEACKNLKAVDAAVEQDKVAKLLPVEGANVSIGSISVDGLSASNLQCRREGGGGLFGGAMGAISGISKRKGRLSKCARAAEDVRVRWTTKGGKIKTVEAIASSPKVEACVKKAIKGASAAFGGTCAATFSIGK